MDFPFKKIEKTGWCKQTMKIMYIYIISNATINKIAKPGKQTQPILTFATKKNEIQVAGMNATHRQWEINEISPGYIT